MHRALCRVGFLLFPCAADRRAWAEDANVHEIAGAETDRVTFDALWNDVVARNVR